MKRLAAASLALALTPACTAIAPPADYAAYRRSRVTPGVEERLAAAHDYLAHYPRGAFADEVKADFAREEGIYWKNKRETVAGLASYLRALPSGPHGVEAVGRLSALRTRDARGEQLRAAGLETASRLDRAVAARVAVRDALVGWVGRGLFAPLYTAPMSQAPKDTIVPWALSLPAPHCAPATDGRPPIARRCQKVEEIEYFVVANNQRDPRQATVSIAVEEDVLGRPLQVTVSGPELFLRVEEAAVVRAFDKDDSEHRVGAVARAVALVRGEFEKRVSPDASCARPTVAPMVLDLRCGGMHLTARVGIEPGEDDVVVMRPL